MEEEVIGDLPTLLSSPRGVLLRQAVLADYISADYYYVHCIFLMPYVMVTLTCCDGTVRLLLHYFGFYEGAIWYGAGMV